MCTYIYIHIAVLSNVYPQIKCILSICNKKKLIYSVWQEKKDKTLPTDSDRQQIKIIQATKCTLWKWLISLCRLNVFWGRITYFLAIYFIDKAYFIRYCFAFCRQMHVVKFPISFGGWKVFFHRFSREHNESHTTVGSVKVFILQAYLK